ncbi:complement factor H-related protein 1 isoform X1 [Paramisgurnus dabryanus]|uniref:complement factor H-related protein 1 isoform X1 n=1 Tax=Paramisgurnus dabryanus TaxID=90735 RepID=UPI0031F3DB57
MKFPLKIGIAFWVLFATSESGQNMKCELPHDKRVYLPKYYFYGNLKLGVVRSYSCLSGYRQISREATCTQNGWKPDPLCTEIVCDQPKIPNAQIIGNQKHTYKISSTLQYHCLSQPQQLIQITCDSEGQWTGIQPCTDGTCQEQELKNVKIIFGYPGISSPYLSGHVLVFLCTDVNMKMYGQRAIECQSDGRWSKPYPHCGGAVQCSIPAEHLRFVTLLNEKNEYSNLDILRYKCIKPYNETSEGALMCQNGKWNGTYACTNKICPPPPYLENGDYIIKNQVNEVITEVYYTCQSYYVLNKQQEYYKCLNGRWETPPKCLKPCEINEVVEMYNLQPPEEKVYLKHNNKHRLNCTSGWQAEGLIKQTYVDILCSDGNLQIDKSCNTEKN